jgi:hypothetical protein
MFWTFNQGRGRGTTTKKVKGNVFTEEEREG